MRAITLTGPDSLRMLDTPQPVPGKGQVLIRTRAAGICATDLEMIAGNPRVKCPAVLGHEWCGTVAEIGPGVNSSLIGNRVVGENLVPCGRCDDCRNNRPCMRPDETGFERPGAYGEYFLLPASNLHPIPDDMPIDIAALAEPVAVCLRGTAKLRNIEGRDAIVFGDGPIGLICVLLLSRRKGKVTCVGMCDERLSIAREFGAERTMRFNQGGSELKALKTSFHRAVEASGSADGFEAAFQSVQKEGDLLILGDYHRQKADFLLNDLLHGEIRLVGSNGAAGYLGESVKRLQEIGTGISPIITHSFPAERYAEAIQVARGGRAALKVMIQFE